MKKNEIGLLEIKEIVYHPTRQYFYEESSIFGSREDFFKTKEKMEKIIHSGNATIVILDDGSKGVAKCGSREEYNKTTGIKVAYLRAKIKSLEKELAELIK